MALQGSFGLHFSKDLARVFLIASISSFENCPFVSLDHLSVGDGSYSSGHSFVLVPIFCHAPVPTQTGMSRRPKAIVLEPSVASQAV